MKPGEGSFRFPAQVDLRRLRRLFFCAPRVLYQDLNQGCSWDSGGAGDFAGIEAAGGDEVGLSLMVWREGVEDGHEVLVGEVLFFTPKEPADETAGDAGVAGEVALGELMAFRVALEGDAEIAHRFAGFGGRWFIVVSCGGLGEVFLLSHLLQVMQLAMEHNCGGMGLGGVIGRGRPLGWERRSSRDLWKKVVRVVGGQAARTAR